MPYRRFVALGDSPTEGLMDLYPDGSGYRGWADRLAEHIDAADPGLLYANLGIRGGRSARSAPSSSARRWPWSSTWPASSAASTTCCGRGRPRRRRRAHARDGGRAECRRRHRAHVHLHRPRQHHAGGAERESPHPRLQRQAARRRRGQRRTVDRVRARGRRRSRWWAAHRLHANAEGHRRIASAAAEVLGIRRRADLARAAAARPTPSRRAAAGGEVRWLRALRAVGGPAPAPALVRDGLTAKRPMLVPLYRGQPVA